MARLSKEQLPWLAVTFFAGLAIGALIVALNGRTQPAPIYITPASPTSVPAPSPTPSPINVHLSGEVLHPDVYQLPAGAIMRDAIEAAGGLTGAAAADLINLALPLTGGMHIHVPALVEAEETPALIERAAVTIPHDVASGDLINLNTATLEELELLPGIGPATGQKIIDYRQANGPFATVEDVQNVSGIGPAKVEQIRNLVTVE
jgi:competence protein ComEA